MKTITIELNNKAKRLAKNLLLTEGELLGVLGDMRRSKSFLELGYTGVFDYCERELHFSRAQSYYFKSVVEKADLVPEIRQAIVQGNLTLSQARRIVSVITPENQEEWIAKAIVLPQAELEREVTKENPRAFTKERIRPMTETLSELKTPVDDETRANLNVLKDVLSQKLGKAASLQDVIKWMAKECREKFDPERKAERAKGKIVSSGNYIPGRHPIPAHVRHEAVRRDGNQCTYVSPEGRRCSQKRWLHFHHIIEVSKGGPNVASNIRLLCNAHHKLEHELVSDVTHLDRGLRMTNSVDRSDGGGSGLKRSAI